MARRKVISPHTAACEAAALRARRIARHELGDVAEDDGVDAQVGRGRRACSRPRSRLAPSLLRGLSADALSCERTVIQGPRGQWSRLEMRAEGPRVSRRRGSGVRSVLVCSGTGCGRRGQVQEGCEGLTLRAARRLRLKSSDPSNSAQPPGRRWRSGLTRASGQDRAHPCRRPPQRRSSGTGCR